MNAATMLLKSLIKTAPRPQGARIESMVSTAVRRELSALRKLSKPMDSATAEHLRIQGIRVRKWAR